MNLALLLEEWVKLKAQEEYAKNRLIFYSKQMLEIEKEKKEYIETIEKIEPLLNSIEYNIFCERFIYNKKIWEIAQDTKYSESHIKRIIKNIKNKLNDTKMKL